MSRGWWTLGRFHGAPIRLHWTVPLGALIMGQRLWAPGFWLGFVLLILMHELGHALLVLRYRLGLTEIAVHGAGGYCRHARTGTRFQDGAVAWGGVLAQLVVLLATYVLLAVLGPPRTMFTAELVSVFTYTNLILIGLNLIPIEPLDGARAWPLLGMLRDGLRRKQAAHHVQARRRSVKDELRALEKLDTRADKPSDKTDRIVRDLISRTTQSKD